jgi:hypothetical protein
MLAVCFMRFDSFSNHHHKCALFLTMNSGHGTADHQYSQIRHHLHPQRADFDSRRCKSRSIQVQPTSLSRRESQSSAFSPFSFRSRVREALRSSHFYSFLVPNHVRSAILFLIAWTLSAIGGWRCTLSPCSTGCSPFGFICGKNGWALFVFQWLWCACERV